MGAIFDDEPPTGDWRIDRPTVSAPELATEHRFILHLLDHPADVEMRMVYADWLEERGHHDKALLVRWFLAPQPDPEEPLPHDNFDPDWLAVVSEAPIDECDVTFAFRCPKRWTALTPTDQPTVRFCATCERNVYFCADYHEVRERGRARECVAFSATLLRRDALDAYRHPWPDDIEMGEVAGP